MRIRIKKAFAGYRIGQEFDWADGMARIYIGRGMAEEVTSPSSTAAVPVEERSADDIEEATIAPKVERAVMQQKRRPK